MSVGEGDLRVEQPSAAMAVSEALARIILTEMSPGVSLPSEADLAARYDVSRLTIREAVKLLEGRGLLAIAKGRRAVVREPSGAAFGDFLTTVSRYDSKGLLDLIEVRLSLEVQSATLAAKRATRAGIAAIESELQGMREAAGAPGQPMSRQQEGEFHSHDLGFHEAVALASGNRVLGYLFEAMSVPLRDGFFISRRGNDQRGQTLHDTIAAHQRILDAIKARSSRAAADAMRSHLKDSQSDLRAALNQPPLRRHGVE